MTEALRSSSVEDGWCCKECGRTDLHAIEYEQCVRDGHTVFLRVPYGYFVLKMGDPEMHLNEEEE